MGLNIDTIGKNNIKLLIEKDELLFSINSSAIKFDLEHIDKQAIIKTDKHTKNLLEKLPQFIEKLGPRTDY